MSFKRAVLAIALTVLVTAAGSAQTASGIIAGRVLDAQGLPLPGTTVTVQGVDFTQTFTTTADGQYRFLELPPGSYKVTAGLEGFATALNDHVVVDPGQTVDLRMTLQISAVRETVTVTAASPIVDTRKIGTDTNVSADELRAMLARFPESERGRVVLLARAVQPASDFDLRLAICKIA